MSDPVYSTSTIIIGYDFSDTTKYSDWNESAGTFTYNGQNYKLGENAFKKTGSRDASDDTTFQLALNKIGDNDATILIDCWMLCVGDYDYWQVVEQISADLPTDPKGTPATWKGTLTIGTIGDTYQSQDMWLSSGKLIFANGTKLRTAMFWHEGSLTIEDDATFNQTSGTGYAYNLVENLTIIADSDPDTSIGRFMGSEGTGYQFSGTCVIKGDGSTTSAVLAATSADRTRLSKGATLTIDNGAAVALTQMSTEQNSTITITDSQFTATALTVAADSTVTLDMDSKLNVTGTTTNAGTIEVDATGFTGVFKKPVDLNGVSEGSNAVTIKNVEDGMTAVITEEGDVFVTSADMKHLLVNTDWATGLAEGDAVDKDNYPGYYYGANALANFADAYGNKVTDVTEDIVVLNGTSDWGGKTYTGLDNVTLESGATLRNTAAIDWGDKTQETTDDIKLIVKGGAALTAANNSSHLYAQACSQIILQGTSTQRATIDFRTPSEPDKRSNLQLSSSSTLTAEYGDIYVDTLCIRAEAAVTLTNSTLDADNGIKLGVNATNGPKTKLTATDSTINVRDYDNGDNKTLLYGTLALTDSSYYTKAYTAALALENNGTVTLDHSTMNLAGYSSSYNYAFTNNAKITLANDSSLQLLNGSDLVNTSTIKLDKTSDIDIDGTNGDLTNSGTITMKAGATITVDGTLTNSGSMSYTWTDGTSPAIAAGAFSGSGTLTIDIDDITGQYQKLIDISGTGTTALADFGTVSLSNEDYAAAVIDNDLYAVSLKSILVDYNSGATLPMGYAWGVNAFTSFEAASASSTSKGTRTYEFIPDSDALMTLTITTTGSTTVKIYDKTTGAVLDTLNVASSATTELEVTDDQSIMLAFNGDNADYSFSASFLKPQTQKDADLGVVGNASSWTSGTLSTGETGYIYTDTDAYVGYKTDAKCYSFEVDTTMSSSFNFAITGSTNWFSYSLIDQNGKVIRTGSAQHSAGWKQNLTSGIYTLAVDGFDKKTGDYNTNFNVTLEAVVNNNVSSLDNAYSNNLSYYMTLSTDDTVTNFVGLGDNTDLVAIDLDGNSGSYTFTLTATEGKTAEGVGMELVRLDGTASKPILTTLQKQVYRLDETSNSWKATIDGLILDSSKTYFLRVTSPSQDSAFRNATYTATMALNGTAITGLSSTDDDLEHATLVGYDDMSGTNSYSNWMGTVDQTDWIQLDESSFDAGTYTFTLGVTAASDLAIATLWQAKTVAGVTTTKSLGTFYGRNDSVTTTSDSVTAILDPTTYDYYIEFKCQNGSNASVDYSLTAQKFTAGYVSSADNTRNTATSVNVASMTAAAPYKNWVGTEDPIDWIKLTDWTAGSHTIQVTADGGQVTADIIKTTTASGSTTQEQVGKLTVAAGTYETSSSIAFAAGSDYYIRFRSQLASNVSAGYLASFN